MVSELLVKIFAIALLMAVSVVFVIGNCILEKSQQNPNLKKDYTKEFELD